MQKPCVLVSGPSIAEDNALIKELQPVATILTSLNHSEIETILERTAIEVLLLETESVSDSGMRLINEIKNRYSEIEIIVINGDGDRALIATAFAMGARDAFPKPYDRAQLVERVKALLRQR